MDFGAHAAQLGGMHIAVFKHRFGNDRASVGAGQQGHHLGLHVGGKAWIGCRDEIDRIGTLAADDTDPIIPHLDNGPGSAQLVEQRPQVRRTTVIDRDIAARSSHQRRGTFPLRCDRG